MTIIYELLTVVIVYLLSVKNIIDYKFEFEINISLL